MRMKWVTRAAANVDRIACPWLIKKFVDSQAEFFFVPADMVKEVAKTENAIPFDAADIELGHYQENGVEHVSFDAIIKKYNLKDPALLELAKIVRGADLATEFGGSAKVPRITPMDTKLIEEMTDELLENLPTLRSFILPGGGRVAAELQFSRAVCRRAERRIVTAGRTESVNPELVPFFNRLSSYLFNLARHANLSQKFKEDPWLP